MLLSVVIPTFNDEQTLSRALDSILHQRDDWPVELIVIDDCSVDGTRAIADDYAQRFQQLVVRQTPRNSGPGGARNLGVSLARGGWILYLDADDEIAPGQLAGLCEHLQQQKADLLAFDWRYAPLEGGAATVALGGRQDKDCLLAPQTERLSAFLGHRIDPSVIYFVWRAGFLAEHRVCFQSGLHEDVDYTFHALSCAQSIVVLDQTVYLKWNRQGSIINTLGERHILGYFDAINHMVRISRQAGRLAQDRAGLIDFSVNVAASRLVRILANPIVKTQPLFPLLQVLYQRVCQLFSLLEQDPTTLVCPGPLETRYYKMLSCFLQGWPLVRSVEQVPSLLDALSTISKKSWSCYDLHHSLFFAPDEIRTCCKRFFYKGRMKGDVVLFKGGVGAEGIHDYQAILAAKQGLHLDINRNQSADCAGCPFLSFADWGSILQDGVRYLSLEYHAVCNMKCTYCSDTYYGGQQVSYDIRQTVRSLGESHALAHCEYIVWGGGEPTLDKQFPELLSQVAGYVPNVRQRIISNASKFSPKVAEMLGKDQAYVVVSIDAGTESTFRQIRQFHGMDRILSHVQRYVQASADNTLIKYIALENNLDLAELQAFVRKVEAFGLQSACFQLSCDFRSAALSVTEISRIAQLAHDLRAAGARWVFIDDLIWQRLPILAASQWQEMQDLLAFAKWDEIVATPARFPEVMIWGTGEQAKLMVTKSRFLREVTICGFVDPRSHAIGKSFMGRSVSPPNVILSSDLPVLIAAVQSTPFIHRQLLAMGVAEERIIATLPL